MSGPVSEHFTGDWRDGVAMWRIREAIHRHDELALAYAMFAEGWLKAACTHERRAA